MNRDPSIKVPSILAVDFGNINQRRVDAGVWEVTRIPAPATRSKESIVSKL